MYSGVTAISFIINVNVLHAKTFPTNIQLKRFSSVQNKSNQLKFMYSIYFYDKKRSVEHTVRNQNKMYE